MAIKVRMRPKFPAHVVGANGFSVTKTNGVWTFGPSWGDLTALASIAAGDLDNIFVLTYNSTGSPTNARASLDVLITTFSTALSSTFVTGPASAADNAIARYDATTGKLIQNSGVLIDDSNNIVPATDDGGALGTTSLKWSDLFLASNGAINWAGGGVNITHSAGGDQLLFQAASGGFVFTHGILPSANDAAAVGTATVAWSDLFLASGGTINWNNGAATISQENALDHLYFQGASGGYYVDAAFAPLANDGAALGIANLNEWSDLFLASGGVINWANGDVTVTHSANALAFAGASSGYTFDVPIGVPSGGSGAATLTGLLRGNGASAFTAISDSSTVGQVLRVTGAATYAWGALDLADSDAVTGILGVANGGTNANLSATGGTSQVLKQASAGAAITVGQLAAIDLSDYVGSTSWTPVITFATPGDLSVTYSLQQGNYVRIGNVVVASFNIVTSAFTHTTASGNFQITGLPISANVSSRGGALSWTGITKAGYTQIALTPSGTSILLTASGSGVATSNVAAADMPTGGSVDIRGTIMYFVAS